MPDISSNISIARRWIEEVCKKVGRDSSEIKLLAATKDVPIPLIEEAIKAGITDIGENRIQEASPKIEALRPKYAHIKWHMIGHLQTNKVKKAIELFDVIQSVDSKHLADVLNEKLNLRNKKIDILIEVKTSPEATKFGVKPEEVIDLVEYISKFGTINIKGLMTVAPLFDSPELARPYFLKLKRLSEEIRSLNIPNVEMKYLSMGMTDDFEVAIEEGSNLVRVGRAIFGIEHK